MAITDYYNGGQYASTAPVGRPKKSQADLIPGAPPRYADMQWNTSNMYRDIDQQLANYGDVAWGLNAEEEKRERWKAENERRRHNYLPFSVEFLRCLAGSGKFGKLVEMARKNAGEKRKRADAWKKTRGGG